MKQYIGTKIIKAEPMTRGDYNDYRGWKVPADEDPTDEGYLMEYENGYVQWLPKEMFKVDYIKCDTMPFGFAIEAMKKGKKVTRKGWNGKGMYLFKSPKVGCQMYKQYTGKDINDLQEFIVMKAADDTLVPWLASQTDLLAEDWMFVE